MRACEVERNQPPPKIHFRVFRGSDRANLQPSFSGLAAHACSAKTGSCWWGSCAKKRPRHLSHGSRTNFWQEVRAPQLQGAYRLTPSTSPLRSRSFPARSGIALYAQKWLALPKLLPEFCLIVLEGPRMIEEGPL